MWICPSCKQPLNYSERQWRCDNNHSFDVAKEGYVNLLLAQHKRSKEPGDNKAMINARRAFLDQGHYQPLADAITAMFDEHLGSDPVSLYDAGCGEGYYLHQVATGLQQQGKNITAAGNDISKVAMQKAAKAYKGFHFAVASSFNLPLADSSQQALLQVFAPVSAEECVRVLAADGLWCQVEPAANHLQQLKQALYQKPEEHSADNRVPEGFELAAQLRLTFEFELEDNHSREYLLMMTPFYWAVEQGKLDNVLAAMGKLTADFNIRLWRKI